MENEVVTPDRTKGTWGTFGVKRGPKGRVTDGWMETDGRTDRSREGPGGEPVETDTDIEVDTGRRVQRRDNVKRFLWWTVEPRWRETLIRTEGQSYVWEKDRGTRRT